ncbi:MAG TPA: type II toxin-antitoxin system VapC family toxin [Terricaulis sp.]|nr:type II toxin-antitoxin system VapC family toxin [Terricaulis sp.]
MNITADTNVLLRAVMPDDDAQMKAAQALLASAALVAVPIPALCEFVWVLTQRYKLPKPDAAAAVRAIIESANVVTDNRSAEAGLAMMDAGGDFADGVIAFEGRLMGADAFVSFDKDAVKQLTAQGVPARVLA